MIAVCDIDGVLADATHRQHHVESRPRDWDAFFAAVGADPLLPEGAAMVAELARDHEVVLLSGRPERTRADTEAWLARHGVPHARLVLRPDADHRPAHVLKAEQIRLIGSPEAVAIVVDDDARVVDRLGSAGYRTRLVG